MTPLSNLVSKLDCEKPELVELFQPEYVGIMMKNITDKTLFGFKSVVEDYIRSCLGDNIVNFRVYSYKTLDGVSVEILIQPESTSIVLQYVLVFTRDKVILKRLR